MGKAEHNQRLRSAVSACIRSPRDGGKPMSLRKAAIKYRVNRGTLTSRVKIARLEAASSPRSCPSVAPIAHTGRRPFISPEGDVILRTFCRAMDLSGHPVSRTSIKQNILAIRKFERPDEDASLLQGPSSDTVKRICQRADMRLRAVREGETIRSKKSKDPSYVFETYTELKKLVKEFDLKPENM